MEFLEPSWLQKAKDYEMRNVNNKNGNIQFAIDAIDEPKP